MLYDLTEDWKLLNELRGTFQNRGTEEIFLKNADSMPTVDEDGISIKPGAERYYEVSSGRIYAQTKRGEVLLAVEGFSPGSTVPAIVPPTLTEKVNKNGEDITAQGEAIAAQGDKIQTCSWHDAGLINIPAGSSINISEYIELTSYMAYECIVRWVTLGSVNTQRFDILGYSSLEYQHSILGNIYKEASSAGGGIDAIQIEETGTTIVDRFKISNIHTSDVKVRLLYKAVGVLRHL